MKHIPFFTTIVLTTVFAGCQCAPSSPTARITGAPIIGARPNHPIHHFVSAIGEGEVKIDVQNLPKGVSFNPQTQMLSGAVATEGKYTLRVIANDKNGRIERPFEIAIGDTLMLTPPMGWNSWYCCSESVSDTDIRNIADAFVARGIIHYGWQYVNIDDCWQGERGGVYNAIQSNERFPDMKSLCDYVHNKGLKIGIYSTPWVCTYAGFIGGSTDNGKEKTKYLPLGQRIQKNQVFGRWPAVEKNKLDYTGANWLFDQDVKQWADWGFDYVKVDWKPNDIPTTKRIAEDIRKVNRDIVLSLSNAAPIENAEGLSAHAQLWRTTGDIHDAWGSISSIGFDHSPRWQKFQHPGAFNDPDMLLIGDIGTPNTQNKQFRPSKLTYEEQRTQVSLWSILAAPMIMSSDIAGMSDSTFALITNVDLIDIHQDPLCIQGVQTQFAPQIYKIEKPLYNGDIAIGFFNRANEERQIELPCTGFDVWNKTMVNANSKIKLPAHGALILRVSQTK